MKQTENISNRIILFPELKQAISIIEESPPAGSFTVENERLEHSHNTAVCVFARLWRRVMIERVQCSNVDPQV